MKDFQAGIDKIPGASALMENLTSVMQIALVLSRIGLA